MSSNAELGLLARVASPLGIAAIVVIGVVAICVIDKLTAVPYPPDIPLIREPKGARRFSLRTRWAYLTDCQALFYEAYHEYLKKGKPVVIPGFGVRIEVYLPQSQMKGVLNQPEYVLDMEQAFAEVDQVRWSLGHEKYVVDAWQGLVVKYDLNRAIEIIANSMKDELHEVFDEQFGTDTDNWKRIDLTKTVKMIVAQAASRFTVGLPLCRNKEYLQLALETNDLFIMNAGLTGGLPRILQPISGTLFGQIVKTKVNKLKKWIIPLLKHRFDRIDNHPDEPQPQDQVQMMINYALRHRQHEVNDMESLARRVVAQNFGSIHNTQIQVSGIQAMTRADSVARESIRLCSFGGRAVFRKVMVDDFKTEDGHQVPKGSIISFMGHPAQTDNEFYEDGLKYDPFRFSRVRETAANRDEKAPPVSFVTTSPEFLTFGHGKHACPGRFLIDFEMKMILAYALRNYDIKFADEYEGKRPPNYWIAEANNPPSGVQIMVKRRERK
ncbi:cycloheximide-inducible CIP70 (cytochrome P450 family) [Fusarium agapanthi]|uniref:Cycloheximide-inducible CIP70 (Cytochrome P450 family) n=1 Tax=Fusarium agapanthi TaxID=1803897 RepID=A0A9P5BK39_9HYPO|nr:cycloheximide-inducible CIP70 (cytochrome P450 family) [Fusarium agapanthi]